MQYEGQSFCLGLYDLNDNGTFNEVGKDVLILAPFQADTFRLLPFSGANYLAEKSTISAGNLLFEIENISPEGRWIDIKEIRSDTAAPTVYLPSQLPEVEIDLVSGEKLESSLLIGGDKFLYVELFSTWHQTSIEATPILKRTYDKYKDRLEVLSLVVNEVDYSRVSRHIAQHDLPWTFGIYTLDFGIAMMHLGYVPYGALYAPDGKLIKAGLQPWELQRFLELLM